MAATHFKTENNTYRKLIGNGLSYRIPRFQRDYRWTTLSLLALAVLKNHQLA